jgi:uncharacterized protein involved in exopolysaccharide biosynthesis
MSTENRPAAAGPKRIRGFGPALRRHWWWLLGVWLLASVGLMAYAFPKTTFKATAWLIVRASTPRIFEQTSSIGDFGRYQKTQVDLITSPDVLGDALTRHPELAGLPLMRGSPDP